jgi:magnesium-transporting ATPase (P-type)
MITGDHPGTALAIGRQLGLTERQEDVVTGEELARHIPEAGSDYGTAIHELVANARIFARVDAVQKLHIVRILQQQGHFIAVTGDGVNDAPALDAAHIGVAMGKKGTDVAKGAADLVIADDNFSSIVAGVEEGRITYDNVRKVTMLLIGTGIGEIVLFVLALSAGLPIPLFAVQLLWLNLVTNGVQDVALAFEKGEPDVSLRRPRPPEQPIFERRMITSTVLAGSYMGVAGFVFFWVALGAGVPEEEARTALLLLMVLFENVHIFNCRSEARSAFRVPLRANPWIVIAVFAALALHIGAMSWEPASQTLRMVSIDAWLLIAVVPVALGLLVLFELYKRVAPPPQGGSAAATG